MKRCYPYHPCTRCGRDYASEPNTFRIEDRHAWTSCVCDCDECDAVTYEHAEDCALIRCLDRSGRCELLDRGIALLARSYFAKAWKRAGKCKSPARSRCQATIVQ